MSARHLRRSRSWWLRRTAVGLGLLAAGACVGAGAVVVLDHTGDDAGTGTGPASLRPAPGPITIALAGEVRPGAALRARLEGAPDDLAGPFGAVLGSADLAVVDLSAVVSSAPPPGDPGATSWVPASALDELEAAGVDVASLANDRALDLGGEGLSATLDAASAGRLSIVGLGHDEDAAYAAVRRTVGGHSVAVVGAAQQLEPSRIASDTATAERGGVASAKRADRLVTAVEAAAAEADVVVVYLHWGEAGQECPSTGQLELAAVLVDAGADVVAGTGAGVVQGAGRMGGAIVAYGLGGLVADDAAEGGVLQVRIDRAGVAGWDWLPGRVDEGVVRPADPAEASAVAADLDARRTCARLAP